MKAKVVCPISMPLDRPRMRVEYDEIVPDTKLTRRTVVREIPTKMYVSEGKYVIEALEDVKPFSLAKALALPRKGLVAEYPFFEGSGTVLHDTSGNGNDGTIYGATWVKLPTGKWVLSFDGVDDCVRIKANPLLKPDKVTVLCWCYLKSVPHIVNAFRSGYYGWVCGWSAPYDYRLKVWVRDTTWHYITLAEPPPLGEWAMIGLTAESDGEFVGYLNGEAIYGINIGTITYDQWDILVGAEADGLTGAPRFFWDGYIGYGVVYNKILDESEISDIYEATKPLFLG